MPLDPVEHLGLARMIGRRYAAGTDPEAVIGAAVVALVEKAPDFEEDRGVPPSAFLWWYLVAAAQEERRRQLRQQAERLYVLDENGEERERPDLPAIPPAGEEETLVRELRDAVAALPAREARIVSASYGLDGSPPLTLSEIGAREGLSRQRVQQLRAKAEERLRRRLRPAP